VTWDGSTAAWWAGEIASDAAYPRDVDPLLDDLIPPDAAGPILDLGCGEGRLSERATLGIDASADLLATARDRLQVVRGDVGDLPFGEATLDGAFAVLVLEHLPEPESFFAETARVVRPDGWLAVILNHPLWTPVDAGPFVDPTDGEVLWRWGGYLERGFTDEPVTGGTIRFHHRPMGDLLTVAADEGWMLERLHERPVGHGGDPLLAAQTQIPRLLGARWRRLPAGAESARGDRA
jgi:SAM-dependent methyltransferase